MMKSKNFIVLAMACVMMVGTTSTVREVLPSCILSNTGQTTNHCDGFNRPILRCHALGHNHYVCGTCEENLWL